MTEVPTKISDEKIKALDELFEKSKYYKNSKNYFDLLNFINKFPKHSPFNAMLIHMQNRGVKVVMTQRNWLRKYNRTIKYGARPLVILVPFGPVEFVYDIKDTEGGDLFSEEVPEELINMFYTKGELPKYIFDSTVNNCIKDSIKYRESDIAKSLAGFATHKEKEYFDITVNITYGLNEKYSTLIHELGHIFCGHLGMLKNSWWKDRRFLSKDVREIEAESIAFLTCTHFGLDTKSESYLTDYISKNQEMPQISLDTILTVSGYIESMGTNKFKKKKKKETK